MVVRVLALIYSLVSQLELSFVFDVCGLQLCKNVFFPHYFMIFVNLCAPNPKILLLSHLKISESEGKEKVGLVLSSVSCLSHTREHGMFTCVCVWTECVALLRPASH